MIAALAVLLGAMLQSATGFGFALAAAPLLVAVLGPRTAVSTMVLLALVVTLLTLAAERRRPHIDRREAVALVAWSLPGLLVGVLVLRLVPERGLAVLVLASVIAAVLLRLRAPVRIRQWSSARAAATGVTSGVLSTSTGVGGPRSSSTSSPAAFPAERMRGHAHGRVAGGRPAHRQRPARDRHLPPAGGDAAADRRHRRGPTSPADRVFALLEGERYERAVLAVLFVTALVALGTRISA